MNDNTEGFEDVMRSLENEFAVAELEKRAVVAVALAEVSGLIIRAALESGVPYEMAQEMARDFWASEMGPAVEVIQVFPEGDDE